MLSISDFGLPTIGVKIQRIRKERGLTRGELAKKIGMETRGLWYVETNSRNVPGLRLLARIAKGLDVELSSLVTDVYIDAGVDQRKGRKPNENSKNSNNKDKAE